MPDPTAALLDFPLPGLPPELDGLRVAVLSDLHAPRGRRGLERVRRCVDAVNAARPDLVVLLGDIVHRAKGDVTCLSAFASLEAPLGAFACLGNHEHGFMWYSRWFPIRNVPSPAEWRSRYAAVRVRVLVNEAAPLRYRGAPLWLLGVDDAYSGHDDLPAALAQVTGPGFRLAITHSPDLMDDPRVGEVNLLLAGHTHGGQICLPGIGPLWAPARHARRRAAGRLQAGPTQVYVTRGAGEALPIRIGCPRELPVLVLLAAAPQFS